MAAERVPGTGSASSYAKFLNYMKEASVIAKGIDGEAGANLQSIVGNTEEFAKGIYKDWETYWSSSDQRKLKTQQTDAYCLINEMQRAYKSLIEVYVLKKDEEEKRKRSIAASKEIPPQSPPQDQSSDSSFEKVEKDEFDEKEIKKEELDETLLEDYCNSSPEHLSTEDPINHEVKEEDPMTREANHEDSMIREVKEEPIEEWQDVQGFDDVDIKEEEMNYDDDEPLEEPIYDFYNPSTSQSRPSHDPSFHESTSNGDNLNSPIPPHCRMEDGSMMKATKRIIVKGHVVVNSHEVLQMGNTRDGLGQANGQQMQTVKVILKKPDDTAAEKKMTKLPRETNRCVLCRSYDFRGTHTPTDNSKNRETFLKSVKLKNLREKCIVDALQKNDERAFFCLSHIGPPWRSTVQSTFVKPAKPPVESVEFSEEVRPEIRRPEIRRVHPVKTQYLIQRPGGSTITEARNAALPTRAMIQARNATIPGNFMRCDLCGKLSYPVCHSPRDKEHARRFFNSLVNLTPHQKQKVTNFKNTGQRATVCRDHILVVIGQHPPPIFTPAASTTTKFDFHRPKNENISRAAFLREAKKRAALLRPRTIAEIMRTGPVREIEMPEFGISSSSNRRKQIFEKRDDYGDIAPEEKTRVVTLGLATAEPSHQAIHQPNIQSVKDEEMDDY